MNSDRFLAMVQLTWGVKIPLRDGVKLNATLYMPKKCKSPTPVIFTLTPYIGQTYHNFALYYAEHGYPYLTVDARGRGNSEGEFVPLVNEATDGHDIVEWLAKQPYCNGQVTMWGGSYAGFDQWTTAAQFPPHLATIVPVASPYCAVDFPMRKNISYPYLVQWLTFVWGRTSQDRLHWGNPNYWGSLFREWYESGTAFKELDSFLGSPLATFQEWVAHPTRDAYWDNYNPSSADYAKLTIPILTITGSYDGDQPGAIKHYREHQKHGSREAVDMHYLVIGPWDHNGTRIPQAEFGGMTIGPASLIDLGQLHCAWYAWTMQGGLKPEFLEKHVAYYVIGADVWRYVDTLDMITTRFERLYLDASANPTDVFFSGSLVPEKPNRVTPDHYVYDPRDMSLTALESEIEPALATDQIMVHAKHGKQLVYHTAPFVADTEVSGFFELSAWIAIDQPDTDIRVTIYEIGLDGTSVRLTDDAMRARYRENLREEKLITTTDPLLYTFDEFKFISRRIERGHRLRLVIGPSSSIYSQRNHNTGGIVAEETLKDARSVTVRLFHDAEHPSELSVPIGYLETKA
jgi:putative CocE/NonD family hydrolase